MVNVGDIYFLEAIDGNSELLVVINKEIDLETLSVSFKVESNESLAIATYDFFINRLPIALELGYNIQKIGTL